MPAVSKKTVSISPEQADYIDAKVASGEYASASEVVRDGLRALQTRDAVFERFVREQVVPVYDEMKAHPERGIPIDEAFAELDRRIAAFEAGKS